MTTVVRDSVIWAYFRVPEKDYLESVTEWSSNQQNQHLELTLADGKQVPQT